MSQPDHAALQRDIGRLEGRMEAVERELREMKQAQSAMVTDIKAIRSTLDQAKGGWKTLLVIATAGGAIGALFMKLANFAGVIPK